VNRRGFISLLSGVAATAVLDPEKLLWQPGRKTYFISARHAIWAHMTPKEILEDINYLLSQMTLPNAFQVPPRYLFDDAGERVISVNQAADEAAFLRTRQALSPYSDTTI
jgi:hypothetical protein